MSEQPELPGWLGQMPEEFVEALARVAQKLAEVLPRVEPIINAYIDHGISDAEDHANEGDA